MRLSMTRRAGRRRFPSLRQAWIPGLAAMLLAAPGCSARPAPAVKVAASALQFIADDYSRAQDEAKRRSVPIFVEAWAPW